MSFRPAHGVEIPVFEVTGLALWLQHAVAQDMVDRPEAWAAQEDLYYESWETWPDMTVEARGGGRFVFIDDLPDAADLRRIAASIAFFEGARAIIDVARGEDPGPFVAVPTAL